MRIDLERVQRGGELDAAARHPRMRRLGVQHRVGGDFLGGLADRDAVGGHQSGRDRRLRPRAALEQAALDQQPVDAPADQASFTVLTAASLPSASNTLATMPLRSRPAIAYIVFGES